MGKLSSWALRKASEKDAVLHNGAKAHEVHKGRDGHEVATPRTWSDKRPAGMAAQTWMQHFKGRPSDDPEEPMKHMTPTAERKARVHDPIMNAALKNKPLPAADEKKIAIMTMGGPASGKSSMLKNVDKSKFVVVDPDHIKGALPEYVKAIGNKKATYKKAAFMAHEESSYLAKKIRDEAIKRGNHVIIDGTGANADKFLKTMGDLKGKGYEVQVHYPHLGAEEGSKRVAARANGSGRMVPAEFVHRAYKKIDENLERIRAAADNFHAYDASKPGHPKISTKENGKETVHDEATHAAFVNRKRM